MIIIKEIVKFPFKNKKMVILTIIVLAAGSFFAWKSFSSKSQAIKYQTVQVEKGTLVVSVTSSGQVSSINSASVTTEASGVIAEVYVKDGDRVIAGDKIALIDLDLEGKQRSNQALASYQSAKNSLSSQEANFYSLQSDMLTKWKDYMDIAQSATYQNPDKSPKTGERQLPQFMSTNDDWLAAEAKYKNQQDVVNQAQTSLSAAWMFYQQSSPVIYAPISGTITGLSLQKGAVITTQRSSTSNTATTQKVASIKTDAAPFISISLTEIDVPRVKVGLKATVTFDALPDKTFTGKVVSVDTVGSVSSGVTTYPTVIALDNQSPEILPNMATSASIITDTKDDVFIVPSAAIQSQNGETYVRVLNDNQISQVTVETGLSSDTQTEIVSGVKEGDTVVTSISSNRNTNSGSTQTQSPFSAIGGRGFGGGGNIRIR